MCDADGRATTGPVYCAGVSQCFDDIGINHPPMNSGVISLNSPWLPLHMYVAVKRYVPQLTLTGPVTILLPTTTRQAHGIIVI